MFRHHSVIRNSQKINVDVNAFEISGNEGTTSREGQIDPARINM